MALLSSPVSSLINGVSQQPATLRFPSQVASQENAYSSVTSGLTKRHPSKHLAGPIDSNVNAAPYTSAFTHTINRDTNERYEIVAYYDSVTGDTTLKAFDIVDGVAEADREIEIRVTDEVTPIVSADLGYISSANMGQDLRAVTVVDHTWLVNTTKQPIMDATSETATRKTEALIVFWKYNHAHNYKIRVEDKVFQWRSRMSNVGTTEVATNEAKRAAQSQGWMAEQMYILLAGLDADSTFDADHDLNIAGSTTDMHVNSSDITSGTNTPAGSGGKLDADSNNGGQGLNGDDASNTGAGGFTDWVIRQTGPYIHIYRSGGGDFDIEVIDDAGDDSLTAIKGDVQQLADLPSTAPNGMVARVVGDSEAGTDDDYYVEFSVDQNEDENEAARPERQAEGATPVVATDNEAFGDGVWVETTGPGVDNKFDVTLMPHKLIRKYDDAEDEAYFVYEPADWDNMPVGDVDTNPPPTFINVDPDETSITIRDIFFYQNRLGLLADDNVIMSEVGAYDNFWRTTIVQLLDGDPIDIGVAHTSVAKINHAVPFSDSLVLFSEHSQFHMKGDDALTPTTTSIQYMSEFENSKLVQPVPTGRSIFFAQSKAAYSSVREYYTVVKSELMDAVDVTAHVPTYLTGEITKMAGSTHDNIVAVLTDGEPGTIFIYKYLVGKEDKIQSSWSKYTLEGATILNIDWVDTELILLTQHQNESTSNYELFLEKMTIEPGVTDVDSTGSSIGYVCNLDRRVIEADCTFANAAGETTITLPYVRGEGTFQLVFRKDFEPGAVKYPVGSQLTIQNPSANDSDTIVVSDPDDIFKDAEFFLGKQYTMEVELSTHYIKPQPGAPIYATGRFQLMYGHLLFDQTDYVRVEVTPSHRNTSTTIFNGGLLGATSIVGGRGTTDGKLKFPIYSKNTEVEIKIINDTPLATAILGLEYESSFNPRARRIG